MEAELKSTKEEIESSKQLLAKKSKNDDEYILALKQEIKRKKNDCFQLKSNTSLDKMCAQPMAKAKVSRQEFEKVKMEIEQLKQQLEELSPPLEHSVTQSAFSSASFGRNMLRSNVSASHLVKLEKLEMRKYELQNENNCLLKQTKHRSNLGMGAEQESLEIALENLELKGKIARLEESLYAR